MSLVTMARKVKAQQGVSKKGFSLNGTYKESGTPRTTVKTSLTSRRNRYNTAVCFGGQEGIQCERVWDGKKEVPKDGGISMAGGDAIRASEYIDRLRYTVARCKNLLFKTDMIGADVKVILEGDNYIIRSNEKNYPVKWYNSTGAIKVLADTGSGEAIIKSISVTGRRTTTIKNDNSVELSFENPERTIFEPVGCDTISDGSGLGGTAGSDNRGYYGRGSCKVHYVNKDPAFEPKGYDGPGGYLDMIKMPHDDTARYCGN